MGLVQNGLFSEMEILPNDSDAPFLARHGGAERHEESENGADGAFRTNALIGAADDANRRVIFPLAVREYRGTHRQGLVRDILSIQDANHRTVSDVLFDRFPDV